jgi:hypothetical protein
MESRLKDRQAADASAGFRQYELNDYLQTPLEDLDNGDIVGWWGVSA